ncbi:hypothetical protein CLM62_24130 [Streptomyces sp. SA15]|nr:hypothetical protein CLM62_24130 [Streptomyces sp. SA15]
MVFAGFSGREAAGVGKLTRVTVSVGVDSVGQRYCQGTGQGLGNRALRLLRQTFGQRVPRFLTRAGRSGQA